ncbi:hypothetical protein CBL_06413 [Carabus blaptoides fortunei]
MTTKASYHFGAWHWGVLTTGAKGMADLQPLSCVVLDYIALYRTRSWCSDQGILCILLPATWRLSVSRDTKFIAAGTTDSNTRWRRTQRDSCSCGGGRVAFLLREFSLPYAAAAVEATCFC